MGFAIHRLTSDQFPVTLYATRADNGRLVWAVTLLHPPRGGALFPLRVPPLAQWEGVKVDVGYQPGGSLPPRMTL